MAKNASPGLIVRESIEMPVIAAGGGPIGRPLTAVDQLVERPQRLAHAASSAASTERTT